MSNGPVVRTNGSIIEKSLLLEKIKSIKNGRLFRLKYQVTVPIKAEFAHRGFEVIKTVETTTRTGVKYGNIKTVIKKALLEKKSKGDSNFSWIIPNKVRYNSHTENTFLYTAPISTGCNKNTVYEIRIPDCTQEGNPGQWSYISKENLEALGIIQNSYWTAGDRPINDINLANIISIG